MKNPKFGGKVASNKGPSASSSTPGSGGSRKSRWNPEKGSSDHRRSPVAASGEPMPSSRGKEEPSALPAVPVADRSAHPGAVATGSPFPVQDPSIGGPPPPIPYGFHNLERRTIVLADGSVRSYLALPPDYPMEPPPEFFPFGHPGSRPGLGIEPGMGMGMEKQFPLPPGGPSSVKRKYGEDDEFAWHRKSVLQYGNPNSNVNPNGIPSGSGGDRVDYLGRTGSPPRHDYHDDMRLSKKTKFGGEGGQEDSIRGRHEVNVPSAVVDVDPQALKKAFLKLTKSINEDVFQKKSYLSNAKDAHLHCIVCGRASKEFTDVHALIMHTYTSQNADLRVDHLGLHKALCVLMGWSYAKAPENAKAYQSLSADDVAANKNDLVIWPPTVIILNTLTGKRTDGRMEGMGNKEMDVKLKELGFGGGKAKSLYGKDGHLGITLVKFASSHAGMEEAERLADFFEKENHGRLAWAQVESQPSGKDDEKNPALFQVDKRTGERKRVFYGHLATASDLDIVDHDTRKKAVIKSRKELDHSE